MVNRRSFFKSAATATAGLYVAGRGSGLLAQAPAKRREVFLAGRRIKVVDVHGHCAIPDVGSVLKGTALEKSTPASTGTQVLGPERIRVLDEQGIDIQVLTQQGAWWYGATDRGLAGEIVRIQNEKTAAWCQAHPDRFVALASVSLQFPDLAAQQLEDAVKRLGMRGGAIAAGHINTKQMSSAEFDPFWAKAQELGVMLFMHPGADTVEDVHLRGKGNLGNTIGNPIETTLFLSHLVFEGVFDRFPRLRVCAAHAGGYIPSYLGRSEAACTRQPNACDTKKKPFDAYFRENILVDTMIFREEGLRHLVAEMGASQLVYGTDIPFPWPVNVDFILNAPFLKDAEKEAILGGTLMKLLRLPS